MEDSWKTWRDTVSELQALLPGLCPEWTDYNLHDPGITLLELFAWLSGNQLYMIRRAGMEHRAKFLKLLGGTRRRRCPGSTFVTVVSERPKGIRIPAGARFYAGSICFENRREQIAVEGIFREFVNCCGEQRTVLGGDWIREGRGIAVFPFTREPRAGFSLEVGLLAPLEALSPYRLYVECGRPGRPEIREEAYDGHGFYPLADIELQYMTGGGWAPAAVEEDGTTGFLQDGSLVFTLERPMAEGDYRLRFLLKRCDYLTAPCITRISLAMVKVWQQETLEADCLPSFTGTGFPGQTFDLEDGRIQEDTFLLRAESPERPGEWEDWQRVEDFDGSGPEDRHYCLENGILTFGDGIRGLMPEGRIQVVRMVRTLGDQGNIKAGSICRAGLPGIGAISHEKDVEGGTGEETVEEALRRIGGELAEGKGRGRRAVTLEDYEELVARAPGLLIEACRAFCPDPEKKEIILAVKPGCGQGKGRLNQAYRRNLYRYLEEKRMIGVRLKLVSPEYCDVTIACSVCAEVKYRQAGELVEAAIRDWVRQRGFGQGIVYGELLGMIDALPCVRRAGSLWLDSGGRGRRSPAGDLLIPPWGLLWLKGVTCNLTAPEG